MNLETRLRSTAMRTLSSGAFQRLLQRRGRLARRLGRDRPAVHYFHQADDPYSQLAVQKLDALRSAYAVPFVPHLVSGPAPAYQGSADHFAQLALRDAMAIASDYGTHFPSDISGEPPGPTAVDVANQSLAGHLAKDDFADVAQAVGVALWTGDLSERPASDAGQHAVAEGDALRRKLGHYLGGMFYFEGEWFWGLDRLRLLEQRLIDEGYAGAGSQLCVPQPIPVDTSGLDASQIQLEYFPSLRSPYTAIGHRRVLDLIARSGVSVKLRPVMPMLMRGVPAPQAKQRYIITDAGREGRAHGAALGRIVDPFGEPVKRAFALFPAATSLGKGMDFVTAYLSGAWVEGVDITTETGLCEVAGNAGIDWAELHAATRGTDWQTDLDANLNDMLAAGMWGVPSFRVTGGTVSIEATGTTAATPFTCWGQDRIWRVENEIAGRVENRR